MKKKLIRGSIFDVSGFLNTYDVGYDTRKNKKKGKTWFTVRHLTATVTPKKKKLCYHRFPSSVCAI